MARECLAGYLRRLDELFEAKHSLVDATGRDMVDGRDRSALVLSASIPPAPPRWHGNEGVLATAPAGGSRLLIIIHPKFKLMGLLPYYLWIFLLIAALGYALAVYLGRPLRNLRHAVEQFGRGDLTIRTRSTRRDEIGELARAFDLMAGRTENLMTAERRLLQDVSHELRTPLSRLRLTVRLARTSDKREAALDRIKKEADRLSSLVDGLLQVTAAEEDPQSRDQEDVRLDALLKDLVDDGTMEAEAKGCRLTLRANEPTTILGDEELLRRAIENVLRNAIRHAPDGTPIEVDIRRRSGTTTITVRDFGTGVPDESLPAIFQPFYRVDDERSRSRGGVGLGLSITQRADRAARRGDLRPKRASGSRGDYQAAGDARNSRPRRHLRFKSGRRNRPANMNLASEVRHLFLVSADKEASQTLQPSRTVRASRRNKAIRQTAIRGPGNDTVSVEGDKECSDLQPSHMVGNSIRARITGGIAGDPKDFLFRPSDRRRRRVCNTVVKAIRLGERKTGVICRSG